MKSMTAGQVKKMIDDARSPRELFGSDIEKTLRQFKTACHPDLNVGDTEAEETFKQLDNLAKQAKEPPITIKSPKRKYEVLKRIATGDVADIHLATSGKKDYLLKISRINDCAGLLDSEREIVAKLLTVAGDKQYRYYYPTLVESFPAHDSIRKRINVFTAETYGPTAHCYTAQQIHDKFPAGLDGRHIAWMFKRVLTAIGFAHRVGFVHGAVLPPHLLYHSENHGVKLLDWIHAVKGPEPISVISKAYAEWYPPEVTAKKQAGPATDIYLAAKCMVYLAGGDPLTNKIPDVIPHPIIRFLESCLLRGFTMRPNNAWDLLDDFTATLKDVYGRTKFHVLSMT